MKLLVVSHSCATAINRQIYEELERQTGWNITLVIPSGWKDSFGNILNQDSPPESPLRVLKIPVWMNGSIILHVYKNFWGHFLQQEQFDAIYVNHEPYAPTTAHICMANMHTRRVPFGFYSCQNIPKKYLPPFSWLEKMVYRNSDFAFPITATVADVLRTKGFQEHLNVCPLPFDPLVYRPYSPETYPSNLPKGKSIPLIGYVGRLVEEKGLKTLALALSRIKNLPWKLVLVGSGPFEQEFDRLSIQENFSDRIIKPGYIPHTETPRYLAAFDMLVLPSETRPNWKEQFGRVIIESLACGTPVVGSDSGEIPNLLRQSGGGPIFQEGRPEALADALSQLLADPSLRLKYAEQGRRWVANNISMEVVARTMATAIRSALPDRDHKISKLS